MSGLTLHPLRLALRAPLATAHGELRVREGWSVCFEASGVTGWGEALPLPAFGTETLAACGQALERARAGLREGIASLGELADVLEAFEATPVARFALESALLDWLGHRERCSVGSLLGGVQRTRLEVNALLSGATEDALVRAARDVRSQGFQTVKLKVGVRPIPEDVARVFAVREVLGHKLQLRIDANGAWSTAQAVEALEAMAPARLELCEQPTPPKDLEGLAAVKSRGLCPIAADEALLVPGAATWLLAHNACDVLVLKPMALGGLLRAVDLAKRAAEAGVDAYVTSLIDGDRGRAAAAQVASVLPTSLAHGLATGALLDAPVRTAWLDPDHGALTLPAGRPGLGLEAVS